MNLEEINSKKETFKVDIRRKHREKHFHDVRENVVLSRRVNEALEQFSKNQSQEIPQVCIIDIACIDMKQLEPFLDPLMNNQLQLIKKNEDKRKNVWFFDCTSVINLRFMTELCKMQVGHILAGFFHATVEVYRQYYDFYVNIALRVQRSGCYISEGFESKEEKESKKLIEFMESPQGTQAITALLEFWGVYISKSEDYILIEHFVMMMKLFELFAEYSRIFCWKGSLSFILWTLIYIRKMKILDRMVRRDMEIFVFAEDCLFFVRHLKMRMPYIMKQYVESRQFLPEIAQILLEFYKLNSCEPGIFYECLFQCHQLRAYFEGLLLKSRQQDGSDMIGKTVGLRLLNCLMAYQNVYQILYLEGAIKLARILCDELVFQCKLQRLSAVVLYNLAFGDREHNLVKIFEGVDYQELLNVAEQTDQADRDDTYEFLMKVMEVYHENKTIYDALLVKCDLEVVFRQFYRQVISKKGYELLAKLVSRNMDFFVKNYRKTVEDMWHHCQEINFKSLDLFQKRVREFNELTTDQKL